MYKVILNSFQLFLIFLDVIREAPYYVCNNEELS